MCKNAKTDLHERQLKLGMLSPHAVAFSPKTENLPWEESVMEIINVETDKKDISEQAVNNEKKEIIKP